MTDHEAELREASVALSERRRSLDAVWLAVLGLVVAGIGLPWFVRALEVDLSLVAWSIFGYALVYLRAGSAIGRLKRHRSVLVALELTQAASATFLAGLWHLIGGLDHPSFLLVFCLPVLASGVLFGRRQALVVAAVSVAAVGCVGIAESAELRWYLLQLRIPVEALAGLLPRSLPGRPEPFPGFAAGPAFQFVVLLLFGLFQFAVALVSNLLAARLLRVWSRLAPRSGEETEGLFRSALRTEPTPTAFVYADTGQLIDASRSFVNQMLLEPDDITRKTLFEVLEFADARGMRKLLATGGEIPAAAYHVGPEERMARVRCHRVRFGDTDYARLSILDREEIPEPAAGGSP